jgi:hypothetical protein
MPSFLPREFFFGACLYVPCFGFTAWQPHRTEVLHGSQNHMRSFDPFGKVHRVFLVEPPDIEPGAHRTVAPKPGV